MKDGLGWNQTTHKLHSDDAFIRIGILQAKIMRKEKAVSQMINDIKNISTWNIQQNKNMLFAQRICTFSKKIGSSEILAICLQNLLPLFPPIPPYPRLIIFYLISKCHSFLSQTQILGYLSEAVVLIGKDLHQFEQYGIYCCLQFCKFTQVQSEFYLIFKRCLQFLQRKTFEILFGTSKNKTTTIQYGVKQRKNRIQQISIKNNQNIKLKRQQKQYVQYLFQLYAIGSIKCFSVQEKEQNKIKIQKLVDELKHYGCQLLFGFANDFKKFFINCLDQTSLNGVRVRKLAKKRKQYHIKLQNLQKPIYIPPIIFKNQNILQNNIKKLNHEDTQNKGQQINKKNKQKNISNQNSIIKQNDQKISLTKEFQINIISGVYKYSYNGQNLLKQINNQRNQINQGNDGVDQCLNGEICVEKMEKVKEQIIQIKQESRQTEQIEQIMEQCQKISKGTSQFCSKMGQFGTTCDSAQFNSFQLYESPQLIIRVDSETEEDLQADQQCFQNKVKQQISNLNSNTLEIDQILAEESLFNNIGTSKIFSCPTQKFHSTDSFQLVQLQFNQPQSYKISSNNQQSKIPQIKSFTKILTQLIAKQVQFSCQKIYERAENYVEEDEIITINKFQQYQSDFQINGQVQSQKVISYQKQPQKLNQCIYRQSDSNDQQPKSRFSSSQFQSDKVHQSPPDQEEINDKNIKEQTKQQYIDLVYYNSIQIINKLELNSGYLIFFFYRLGLDYRQKQQIVGYLSKQSKFNIQKSKLIFVFPFKILQNLDIIKDKIVNQSNYCILGKKQAKGYLLQYQKQQKIEDLKKQYEKNRIIVFGLWTKIIESHFKIHFKSIVIIINYILYEVFYENHTFDVAICLSQAFSKLKFFDHRCNYNNMNVISDRLPGYQKTLNQIGKIQIKNVNTKFWNEFESNVENIIGYSVKFDEAGCIVMHQSLTQQQVFNLIF